MPSRFAMPVTNGSHHPRRAPVTLIAGPPCGGKSSYAREHARPGDLVLDWDTLLAALTVTDGQDHVDPGRLKPLVFAARDAIEIELSRRPAVTAWLINSAPQRDRRRAYRADLGAHVVIVTAPLHVCLARARTQRRREWADYIERWFDRYEPDPDDLVIVTG